MDVCSYFFFNDMWIYSNTVEDHRKHLRDVLRVLKENHLFTKRSNCKFGCLKINYLVHIITDNGISVDSGKLQAVKEWPLPKNPEALGGFLGLMGY